MGKYEITYACGHTEERQLYGKIKDRESKSSWLETQKCYECQKEEKNRKAREDNAKLGLPKLIGSEKQIAWAETIRAEKIKFLDETLNFFDISRVKPEKLEAAKWIYSEIAKIKNETSAKYWIENKDNIFGPLWFIKKYPDKPK